MERENEVFVGIDLGGTKTRIGLTGKESPDEIIKDCTLPTIKESPKAAINAMAQSIKGLAAQVRGRVLAIGIGAPGPFDRKAGVLLELPNLPMWRGFAVRTALQEEMGVAVTLENDANVAALGELQFGAGRDLRDFIYVTLGTGIGGGLILNGHLYTGAFGGAGEIGHIQIDPNGPQCGCGRKGCVETFASGPAIQKAYGSVSERVFELAAHGEEKAMEALQASGRALGQGLAQAVTLLDPEAIILGGGMVLGPKEALSIYVEACHKEVVAKAFAPGKDRLRFLVSSLGKDAGVLGAAWLARESVDNLAFGHLPKTIEKPWGKEILWALTSFYAGKRIMVRAKNSLSLQYHREKDETMFFIEGNGFLQLGDEKYPVRHGVSFHIPKGQVHRVIAETDLEFLEVSTPQLDDVVRLKDDYGRDSLSS